MWINQGAEDHCEDEPYQTKVFTSKTFAGKKVTVFPPGTNLSGSQCNWCGKLGHKIKDCWQKCGACLICGSRDHQLRNCSKQKNPKKTPQCPQCGGAHFRMQCQATSSDSDQNSLN